MAKGTCRMRARVCAMWVLPEPDGPSIRMFCLLNLHIRLRLCGADALVVVIDGDAEDFLGVVLSYHILFEVLVDDLRVQPVCHRIRYDGGLGGTVLGDNLIAQQHTLVADEDPVRPCDESLDLRLCLVAEGSNDSRCG